MRVSLASHKGATAGLCFSISDCGAAIATLAREERRGPKRKAQPRIPEEDSAPMRSSQSRGVAPWELCWKESWSEWGGKIRTQVSAGRL